MSISRKILAAALILALDLPGAMTLTSAASVESADQKFEALAKKYMEQFLAANPETATQLGEHRFDNRLDDYSRAAVERDRAFNQRYLKALEAIPLARLNAANSVDYRILRNRLEYNIFQIDELRDFESNPLRYNIGGAIYGLIARDFAPLKDRLRNVKERLKAIPTVVADAKANLKNPPRVHTETAISQNTGTIALIRDELQPFIDQAPELKAEIAPAQSAAIKALEDYGTWLEKDLLARSRGDFRLGDAKFRRKLRFALESDLSKEEILKRAEADLKSTQKSMYEVALPLYKNYFPGEKNAARLADRKLVIKAVLAKLAEAHPNNETIVPLASEQVRSATDFVRAKNLVSVPDEPVKVIVMPEFTRGVAVAYCNSVGPFERHGETFYAISPTPKDWNQTRTESFFREYNNYMMLDVTVHEAMPGHYLQLAHANKYAAPTRLRAAFLSSTFAEGWGVYAEQLMAEHGFGGPEVRMQQLKLYLRSVINAILDQKVHTAGMTEKEAMALMMNEGFQEEGEAAGKWRRAALTSTQLSTYYVGNLEVKDIRRAYEARMGDTIDYKRMHDAMLSFGTPAPKYVRELMGL
ncbi:MAG TPA: DUF885 domain-containing protein [Pyrinomonadaceae bacterium]|jgi:uncharacterized protein (DUF885 family)|nr:DUF885 domain-containing protein [Pyrinomonadaceae bacterium]